MEIAFPQMQMESDSGYTQRVYHISDGLIGYDDKSGPHFTQVWFVFMTSQIIINIL